VRTRTDNGSNISVLWWMWIDVDPWSKSPD